MTKGVRKHAFSFCIDTATEKLYNSERIMNCERRCIF